MHESFSSGEWDGQKFEYSNAKQTTTTTTTTYLPTFPVGRKVKVLGGCVG
jgi:hypothetical protein